MDETRTAKISRLHELADKPHPNLRAVDLPDGLDEGSREVLREANAAHHLLDQAHIPLGAGYDSDLDVRVLLATERIAQIASRHEMDRNVDGHGGVSGYCAECGWAWPCDTRKMADGEHVED